MVLTRLRSVRHTHPLQLGGANLVQKVVEARDMPYLQRPYLETLPFHNIVTNVFFFGSYS